VLQCEVEEVHLDVSVAIDPAIEHRSARKRTTSVSTVTELDISRETVQTQLATQRRFAITAVDRDISDAIAAEAVAAFAAAAAEGAVRFAFNAAAEDTSQENVLALEEAAAAAAAAADRNVTPAESTDT